MSTLLLTKRDLTGLMTPSDYLAAVEAAFRMSAEGLTQSPPPLHLHGAGGAFHAKGAVMAGKRRLAALKLNANFPANPARGMPTIQGAVLLCDGEHGALLAILDSIEITLRRTAAASALAARHLARADSRQLAIIGCGAQASPHMEALADLFQFEAARVFDADQTRAQALARETHDAFGFAVQAAPSIAAACDGADIIVTCTTARAPFLGPEHVATGAFIAAAGADNPEKSEIAPALMAQSAVVVDTLAQCRVMGDLHAAIAAGAMREADVRGELADVITGAKPGRERADEIVVFDSTGTAIQDVASAATAYERALAARRGLRIELGA